MLRIKYSISKSIDIQPLDIISRIHHKLVGLSYEIVSEDHDTIDFKHNYWKFGSRTEGFTTVDGGKFTVISLKNETKLVLSYYVTFDSVIFFAVFCTLSSLIFGDYHIMFLLLGVSIIHLFRIDNVKSLGKRMIDTILL